MLMRGRFRATKVALLGLLVLLPTRAADGQRVVDRIVARVQDDLVLWSDLRELAEYQQLVEGKAESDAQLLDRLIDQWIVRKEAETARFPRPSDEDIERGMQRLKRQFSTPEDYEDRREQSGLSEAEVRRIVGAQLYLDSYLDSRFRPLVHIEPKAIEEFYNNRVIPRAKARGQTPPSLEASSDYIQEALIQRGIDEQADRWLKESRARIQVRESLSEGET
jgi:hypothetical protein